MADFVTIPGQQLIAVSNAALATAVTAYNTAIAAAVVTAQALAVGPAGSNVTYGISIGTPTTIYNGSLYIITGYVTYSQPQAKS